MFTRIFSVLEQKRVIYRNLHPGFYEKPLLWYLKYVLLLEVAFWLFTFTVQLTRGNFFEMVIPYGFMLVWSFRNWTTVTNGKKKKHGSLVWYNLFFSFGALIFSRAYRDLFGGLVSFFLQLFASEGYGISAVGRQLADQTGYRAAACFGWTMLALHLLCVVFLFLPHYRQFLNTSIDKLVADDKRQTLWPHC